MVLQDRFRVSQRRACRHAASIHKRCWTARVVAGRRAVGAADADSVLGGHLSKAAAVLQVLGHHPETPLLRQKGIGEAMQECVSSGLEGRTSTQSDLTPPCQLNNLLR